MKELYYDCHSLDEEAQTFLNKIKPYREKHRLNLIPKNAALLVIDMQNYFCDELSPAFMPSVRAIIPQIKTLQNSFLEHELLVFQTQHHDAEENGSMFKWWQTILKISDPRAQIIPELNSSQIRLIRKSHYDAFWQTNLESELKDYGISQLVICGVMAHLCCETTARSAFMRGFDVFFTVDGTASLNRDLHLGSLRNLAHGFAMPVLTKDIITQLAC